MNEFDEKWLNLKITNNFIFSKVMQDYEICTKILEMLLGFQLGDITNQEMEKTIAVTPSARGVRLDVYVKAEDKVYNVEMQVVDEKNLPKRSRYYQGIIDLNTIKKGELYDTLKESYVIFICTFDPFKESKPVYTFENFCRENKELALNDGTYKMFFNTKAYEQVEDEDLKYFLAYVNGICNKENTFVSKLEERVVEVKNHDGWRAEFMTLDLLLLENEKKAEARGEARGKLKIAKNLLGKLSVEEIAIITGLSQHEIEGLNSGV